MSKEGLLIQVELHSYLLKDLLRVEFMNLAIIFFLPEWDFGHVTETPSHWSIILSGGICFWFESVTINPPAECKNVVISRLRSKSQES